MIKTIADTHKKYALAYVFLLPLMPFTYTMGILAQLYYAFTDNSNAIALLVAMLIFAVGSSIPILFPNYKSSKILSTQTKLHWLEWVVLLQGITVGLLCGIYFVYGYFFTLFVTLSNIQS